MTRAANEYEHADHDRDLRKHDDGLRYHVILENIAGKLDERVVTVNDDPELTEAVIDFIHDVGSLRDGDVIRIVEMED
jgi:hypothetical protein